MVNPDDLIKTEERETLENFEEGTLKEEQKGESPPGAERTIPGKGRRCVFLRFTKNLLFGTGCIVCDGSPTGSRYCPISHCLLDS